MSSSLDAVPPARATRYRQWLIAPGRFESLQSKIATAPGTARQLAAAQVHAVVQAARCPHVYLWGSGLIATRAVRDWPGLLTAPRSDSPLARQLRQQFDAESLHLLEASAATPTAYERGALMRAFNGGVRRCTPTTPKAETPMERARESGEAIAPPR